MAFERIFSDEELRIGGLRSVDALEEALRNADREAAHHFTRRLRREVLSMIGNYSGWETTLLGWVDRREGVGTADEVLEAIEDFEAAPERGGDASDPGERWRAEAKAISSAVDAGMDTDALERARSLHEEALSRHDRGMSRVSAILSWIGRRAGIVGVADALHEAMSSGLLGNEGFRERAEMLMHFTRVHLQAFDLVEDEEKLTFICPVCPSAGRMIADGHYEAPRSDLVIQGPHPLTYGRDEIPVYCCHEPIMETDSFEGTGVPLFIVEPAERLGFEPCKTYLYKNANDIPERFYTRLGLEKPSTQETT